MSRPPTSDTPTAAVPAAQDLLDAFLQDTGVVGDAPPRRYLWTDAFAVCTLLELERRGAVPPWGEPGYRVLATRLVDQVHRTLGRHRDDDARTGWVSGLDEEEGTAHPTSGGLRIGKPLPERAPDAPEDPGLEWERDGQYFHYLTRWMHALRRVAVETGEAAYLRWAVELARAACRGFVRRGPDGGRRMAWKTSIDLSRPLVGAMGRHDPLDGYLTFRTLVTPGTPGAPDGGSGLQEEIAVMADLAGLDRPARWATDDPLGIGGLLVDAHRVALLRAAGVAEAEGLLLGLLDAAHDGLVALLRRGVTDEAPARRLPFRELGLSLGVHALERLAAQVDDGVFPGGAPRIEERLGRLLEGEEAARRIEATWTAPASRQVATWVDHADINAVMLAASLLPDGYLRL